MKSTKQFQGLLAKPKILYSPFSCNADQSCQTQECPIRVNSAEQCAKCCTLFGANAGSYVVNNSGNCRQADDPFFYDSIVGQCLCYTNSTPAEADPQEPSYPQTQTYQLFRIEKSEANEIPGTPPSSPFDSDINIEIEPTDSSTNNSNSGMINSDTSMSNLDSDADADMNNSELELIINSN